MTPRLNIIVAGLIGQYPIGGVTWDYIQYVLGLVKLGHHVTYLEDSEQWPYNPQERGSGREADYNAAYVNGVMRRFELGDSWAYRFPGGSLPTGEVFAERWYGLSDERRRSAVDSADLLINVSSGIGDPARYRQIPRIAYVDTDPVFTQIRSVQDGRFRAHLDAHDMHFTYGECLSDAVPATGHHWRPIRKPIALDQWRPASAWRDVFTTVMNWTSYQDVTWNGRCYGQKDKELLRFIDLPQRVAPNLLELALGPGITRRAPVDWLRHNGWLIVDPMEKCACVDAYRQYVESSKGEWTPAKNGYVEGRSGWFSGRTACYLAAGRPVVVQDTGFTTVLPVGEGILTFRTMEEAVEGIHQVDRDWTRHARVARAIAEEYFDAPKIVRRVLDASMHESSAHPSRSDPAREL